MRREILPIVKSPLLRRDRRGRGFSRRELETAGLTLEEARKLGIPIDKRRKSAYQENIQLLKNILRKLEEKSS